MTRVIASCLLVCLVAGCHGGTTAVGTSNGSATSAAASVKDCGSFRQVAWALYLVLRPANRPVALLAGWLRIVYAGVFAVIVMNLLLAARFATDAGLRNALGGRQADAQALASMDAFTDGWKLALAIFGIHLLVLGYLVARAVYMPVLLGVLVMIAGVGYLIDAVAGSVWRGYQIKLSAVAFVGEVALMVWLLWRGSRLQNSTAQGRRSPAAASTR